MAQSKIGYHEIEAATYVGAEEGENRDAWSRREVRELPPLRGWWRYVRITDFKRVGHSRPADKYEFFSCKPVTLKGLHRPFTARDIPAEAWQEFTPAKRWLTLHIEVTSPEGKCRFRGVASPDEVTFLCSADKNAYLAVDRQPHRGHTKARKIAAGYQNGGPYNQNSLSGYYAWERLFDGDVPRIGAVLWEDGPHKVVVTSVSEKVKLLAGAGFPATWN